MPQLCIVEKSTTSIVFLAGRISLCRMSAYCVAKYGVEAFSDALRREMSPWKVQVSLIEPGRFKTNIASSVIESVKQLWDDLSPELKKDYGNNYLQKCKYCVVFYPIQKWQPQPCNNAQGDVT